MEKIFFLLLFFSILLQSSILAVPTTFMLLIIFYCYYRTEWIFIAAFVAGMFLDVLLVRPLGITSSFFLIFLFLIFLYQRKFEITSNYFVFFALLIGSGVYFLLFEVGTIVSALTSSLLGVAVFSIMRSHTKAEQRKYIFPT